MSKWLLEKPVLENLLKDIVTDSIEKNSRFQHDSGMRPKVVRRSSGNCCEWCDKIAGTYYYPDIPRDVYRRHNNCNCTVEYYPEDGKKQDVLTKKWSEDKEILEQRRSIRLGSSQKLNPKDLEKSIKKRSDTPVKNVLRNYLKDARPGEGIVTYEKKYDRATHKKEIEAAKWIRDNLGGDIIVLQEIGLPNQQTPDYIWKGKYWELKNPTTEKAADSALRKALHQIKDNPGGIILDYGDNKISYETLMNIISRRLTRQDCEVDVLVLNFNELVKAVRYRK